MVPALAIVGYDWKMYYNYTTDDGERLSFDHRHDRPNR